ncbi:acetolactate decarboxylase [uncultured Sphaerochaeta sp.]|uniref:acetolactate decarboxylase n=1 Tax=uncultured Sphaerochaeta sp. TaxID=886478 RepID=UPI002A0A727D|nr:acetolactate decarboxylase [uncultured Sphaerochaeta sp.]
MKTGNRVLSAMVLVLCLFLASGCTSVPKEDNIYQVSLLNALLQGEYDGFISVGTLKGHGDTGIGTFDTLDGEMIFLDGNVYKAKVDGTVELMDDQVMVPFAVATMFEPDVVVKPYNAIADIETLKNAMDACIAETTNDFNRFYVAKVQGLFSHVRVRSVPSQQKPYRPLSVIASTQKEYTYEQVEGTIVAFRSPAYVEGINLPGWHLHFLSEDKSKGGHLLEATLVQGEIGMGDMKEFQLILPSSSSFAAMDIADDRREETLAIEGVAKP